MSGPRAFPTGHAFVRLKPPIGSSNAQSKARRAALLFGTSLIVCAAVAPTGATAQNECGAPPPGGGTVTCTPAGNPYPNGIDYDPPAGLVADLTVVLEPGVVVENDGTPTNPNGVEIGSSAPNVDLVLQAGTNTLISTNADNHDGVDVVSVDGTVSVAVDDVSTTGDNSDAVIASGRGSVIVTGDTITTTGDFSYGVRAEEGDFILAGDPAGPITPTMVTVNSVTTSGAGSVGISAFGQHAGVTVDSGSVVTSGDNARGILAVGVYGEVRVTSGTVTTGGENAIGIDATVLLFPDEVGPGASVFIDSSRVTTTGDGALGIFATTPLNDITIGSEVVSTSGDDAAGISAFITGQLLAPGKYTHGEGDIVIDSGSVATLGDHSTGIVAAGSDDVTITSDSVSTAGERSPGIDAQAYFEGDVAITSGTVSTLGAGSGGILAETESGSIVITSNSITTAGRTILGQPGIVAAGAHGIEAISDSGSITIDSGSITTGGRDANGIVAETASGAIDITSGTITAADGRGIEAESDSGDITIASGSVTTIGGLFSDGIFAETVSGDIVIDSGSVSVGDGVGIFVINESGDTTITSGEVTVNGSPGIAAYGDYYVGGDIIVVSGSVETTGSFANGIDVDTRGAVSVRSTSIVTLGDRSRGIEAFSGAGGVTIDSGTIATSGPDSRGIQSNVYGEAGVVIRSGTITTLGDNSDGIVVATLADTSTGDFTITSDSVSTQGHRSVGIYAYHGGSGDIVVTSGTVTTAGDSQDVAYGSSGAIELHANTGSITLTSTTVGTGGTDAVGILATSNGGAINITSGSVTTAGNGAIGIFARTGPGSTSPEDPPEDGAGEPGPSLAIAPVASPPDISITSTAVTTAGSEATGIDAAAVDGDVHIESGSVTTGGANSDGIRAGSGAGSVLVDANSVSVSGAGSNAIVVTSATTSTVIARGLIQSQNGLAVQADGGRAIVSTTAGGTIRGRIDLTEGDDSLTNAGLFDAIGTSQFGGGADVFTNSGTTRSINGAAVLAGVETFNNGGTIQMADGAANDRLTIGGTFNGQAGSTLSIDVNFDAGVADVLATGLATGSTAIQIAGQGDALGFSSTGILVVDAGAGTQANAFTLSGATAGNGYVTSGLVFDAANFDFLIVNSPNQPVFETALFGEILTDLWYRGTDAVSAQLDAARDGYGSGGGDGTGHLTGGGSLGGWVQLLAGKRDRDASQAFGATLFDVGYEQDFEGVQAGFDHQSGPLIFGLTFGLGRSDAVFDVTFDSLEMETVNLGAYAAVSSGSFFANLIAKADWIDAETDPGAGLSAAFDATAIGVRGTAGFRFDLGGFWAEPAVSLSWVDTDIDDFTSGGATIAFDDSTSLRGSAGIRIGGDLAAGSARLIPFVGIHAIEEFDGDNRTDFIFGSTLPLVQDAPGTHGEASAGFTVRTGTLEAFVRGELQFGGEVDGRSARAGVRLRF